MKDTTSLVDTASVLPRKAYETPHLTVYGALASLTHAGTGSVQEGKGSINTKRFP